MVYLIFLVQTISPVSRLSQCGCGCIDRQSALSVGCLSVVVAYVDRQSALSVGCLSVVVAVLTDNQPCQSAVSVWLWLYWQTISLVSQLSQCGCGYVDRQSALVDRQSALSVSCHSVVVVMLTDNQPCQSAVSVWLWLCWQTISLSWQTISLVSQLSQCGCGYVDRQSALSVSCLSVVVAVLTDNQPCQSAVSVWLWLCWQTISPVSRLSQCGCGYVDRQSALSVGCLSVVVAVLTDNQPCQSAVTVWLWLCWQTISPVSQLSQCGCGYVDRQSALSVGCLSVVVVMLTDNQPCQSAVSVWLWLCWQTISPVSQLSQCGCGYVDRQSALSVSCLSVVVVMLTDNQPCQSAVSVWLWLCWQTISPVSQLSQCGCGYVSADRQSALSVGCHSVVVVVCWQTISPVSQLSQCGCGLCDRQSALSVSCLSVVVVMLTDNQPCQSAVSVWLWLCWQTISPVSRLSQCGCGCIDRQSALSVGCLSVVVAVLTDNQPCQSAVSVWLWLCWQTISPVSRLSQCGCGCIDRQSALSVSCLSVVVVMLTDNQPCQSVDRQSALSVSCLSVVVADNQP